MLLYLREFGMRDDDDTYHKAYAEAKAKLDAKADKEAEEAWDSFVGFVLTAVLAALVFLAIRFFSS